ncbi:MAG TPA: GNAT family N-acetyltransferase, partial [Roseiflexaceae bacterium]|nr:GNAT family N-acetyltransferase [Roseiflexaceae bacterium]
MTDTVTVTTTYLHIPSRAQFRPSFSDNDDALIMQSHVPLVSFYRFLYNAVGQDYHWTDRNKWTDEQLEEYLARPTTTLLVLYVQGTPAGYVEL